MSNLTNLINNALDQTRREREESASNQPKTQQPKVDPTKARRCVTIDGLGVIQRRKTEDPGRVELVANDAVVGEAVANYITKSQRTWTVTVNGVTVNNAHTINKGLREIADQLSFD